ncbi:MAG: AMP-binding protein [Planctomycetaceae bacterium]|nr:AMP-binding protein [Planctomycetaceae bacterium]
MMSSKNIAPPNIGDYETARREYALDVPELFNYTVDVFEKWARQEPGRTALLVGSADWNTIESHSFGQLSARINRCCNLLRSLGIVKGQRVLVLMGWRADWYVAMLAMIKLGIIPIPTTTQSRPRDLLYRFEVSGAVGVISSAELAGVVDEIAARCPTLAHKIVVGAAAPRPGWIDCAAALAAQSETFDNWQSTRSDDHMLIYFTSGTVAYPKMVLHTQASYGIGHRLTAELWHDLKPTDTHWTMTDTGWGKAVWGCLFGQWTVGATVFVSAAPKFEPQKTLTMIGRIGVTSFCAPPTVYRILVRDNLDNYDLSSLRHCTSAGEPLNGEVIRIWRGATGLDIHDGYGQTETVNVLANYRCFPVKPGSMGKPVPGFDVLIVDDDIRPLPDGNEGHIAIRIKPNRPVGFFAGYLNDEESTAAAFRGDFYLTGDRAYRDSDGYFWFVSRADDVIITSGYRIGPFEIESALIEHPAVKESAVVASPNVLRGEIVKAFVVLADGYEPSAALVGELQQHVRSITAPYKYPRAIEFVKELPKTISGKIKRRELRQREWAGWRGGMRVRPRRRYRRTYRRLGLLALLERLRRSLFRPRAATRTR